SLHFLLTDLTTSATESLRPGVEKPNLTIRHAGSQPKKHSPSMRHHRWSAFDPPSMFSSRSETHVWPGLVEEQRTAQGPPLGGVSPLPSRPIIRPGITAKVNESGMPFCLTYLLATTICLLSMSAA